MVGAMTGDTWGISGPTFLVLYGLVAVGVGLAWFWTREQARNAAPRHKQPITELTRRPQDLAHLNGGAQLAILAMLSAMRLQGTIALSRGTVRAAGHLEPGANELEQAIHRSATRPVHRTALPAQPPVRAALAASERRLERAGLLVSTPARQRIKRIALLMVAVGALGVVRLVAGLANWKPVGYLFLALAVVLVAAIVMLSSTPRRTRLGDRTLAQLRSGRHDLDPELKPDWVVYGASAAALGVGLYGLDALWASDPAMAVELAAKRASGGQAASGSEGGDSGSCGGGGGCGGGCGG